MSNLAKFRTLTGHILTDVVAKLETTDKRLTAPILCNIEKGIVNPTPQTLDALAKLYDTPKEALMDFEEVDYGFRQPSKNALRLREARLRRKVKPFSVYVPAEMLDGLNEKLRICGYSNHTAWLMLKLKALDVESGKIKAAKQKSKGQTTNAESKTKTGTA